jgi:hypothetical protein
MKLAPGSVLKPAASAGSLTQSCAQARRPRSASTAIRLSANSRSARAPSSLRVAVSVREM